MPTGRPRATRQRGSQPASAGIEPSRYAGAVSPGFQVAARMSGGVVRKANIEGAVPTANIANLEPAAQENSATVRLSKHFRIPAIVIYCLCLPTGHTLNAMPDQPTAGSQPVPVLVAVAKGVVIFRQESCTAVSRDSVCCLETVRFGSPHHQVDFCEPRDRPATRTTAQAHARDASMPLAEDGLLCPLHLSALTSSVGRCVVPAVPRRSRALDTREEQRTRGKLRAQGATLNWLPLGLRSAAGAVACCLFAELAAG